MLRQLTKGKDLIMASTSCFAIDYLTSGCLIHMKIKDDDFQFIDDSKSRKSLCLDEGKNSTYCTLIANSHKDATAPVRDLELYFH